MAENLAGCGSASEPSDGTAARDPIKPPSKPGKPNVMEVIIYTENSAKRGMNYFTFMCFVVGRLRNVPAVCVGERLRLMVEVRYPTISSKFANERLDQKSGRMILFLGS